MTIPADRAAFAKIFNDKELYPTIADVAVALGTTINNVGVKAGRIRRAMRAGEDTDTAPFLISRQVPVSEDETKFQADFTAQDCIDELMRMVNEDTTRFITRNAFRNESSISESTWTRFFGTFSEFKRQAEVTPSRQVHVLERQIAKHASLDHYRNLNNDRREWGEKYLRPDNKRFQTILACSDLHDIECDPFYLRVLIDTARRAQPGVISLVGDIFDLPEFGKYGVDPREWDVVGRIKFAHNEILRPLRESAPDAQMDLIEGNHEFRLLRHLADATPALRAVLSDLHGMTSQKLFGLDEFGINYVSQADLSAFNKNDIAKEVGNSYRIYFDSVLCHHFPHGRNMAMPGVNGHHHKHEAWSMFNPVYGAYEWHQMGSGHVRKASYTAGEKWHNGFALIHVDTHTHSVNIEYIPITDFAVVGGQFYTRTAAESNHIAPLLFSR